MSPLDRAERAREIARARGQGVTWEAIAEQHGISSRHARRLAAQVEKSGDREAAAALLPDRPTQVEPRQVEAEVLPVELGNPFRDKDVWAPIRRLLEAIEWAAAAMRKEAASKTPNPARVGAARRYLEAEHARVQLLATVGALPRDPVAHFRYEEARHLARRILDALHHHDVEQGAIRAAWAAGLGVDPDQLDEDESHDDKEAARAAA